MKNFVFCALFWLLVLLEGMVECDNLETITVATYNVWNIMFNWDVRKFRIAQMIKEVNPHVVALQELRAHADVDFNQLDDLLDLLPGYQWSHYAHSHSVEPMKETYLTGWEKEGIGIISRLPIVRHEVQNLTITPGPDTSARVALHAQVLLSDHYDPKTARTVHVSVVHFSYDRTQQCSNSLEVYKYIQERHLENAIILGDFNIYKNSESPAEVFTSSLNVVSPVDSLVWCQQMLSDVASLQIERQRIFHDAWLINNPKHPGLTFSNMPIPGLESRPDRILYSPSHLKSTSSHVTGDNAKYKSRYFFHVIWSRFEHILGAAYDSYQGKKGSSCYHDCGPHASCRCGMCVSDKNDNACLLPNCFECNTTSFYILIAFSVVTFLISAQLIFGILQVMLTMNERGHHRRSSVKPKFSDHFCLCDPQMYSDMSAKVRRWKRSRCCKIWPILRLPPMILVIVSILMIFMLVEFALYAFKDAIIDIYSIIPEELNPSDHLMVYTELEVKKAL